MEEDGDSEGDSDSEVDSDEDENKDCQHKKPWTAEEERELRRRVRLHGEGNWMAIFENSRILQKRFKLTPSGKMRISHCQ